MAGGYRYNYVFVLYDVGEKRCQKVFKVCKKYLNHYQYSVFRGRLSPAQMINMKAEILKVIDKEVDTVAIIKLLSEKYFEEEILGDQKESEDEWFL